MPADGNREIANSEEFRDRNHDGGKEHNTTHGIGAMVKQVDDTANNGRIRFASEKLRSQHRIEICGNVGDQAGNPPSPDTLEAPWRPGVEVFTATRALLWTRWADIAAYTAAHKARGARGQDRLF